MFPIPFNFPFRKNDGSITTISDAISSGGGSYTLPTASANTKGGVKIGSGLTMDGEILNADGYTLPTASDEIKGGVKVGSGLSIDENGVLSASGGGSGIDYVDITTYQTFDNGTGTYKLTALSSLISETDYNNHLADKVILAIEVINKPTIHMMGVTGTTYANTKAGYFAETPSSMASGTTIRFFIIDNPS